MSKIRHALAFAALAGVSSLACGEAVPPAADHRTIVGVSAEPQDGQSLEDAKALSDFLDAEATQEFSDSAGAVIVVVRNGQIIATKEWGDADRENKIPVKADRTLFHVGSISKLITATATMQLIERKQLSESADISTYLGSAAIPQASLGRITLRHLLTHTSGFESNVFGYMLAADPTGLASLAEIVTRHMPSRVRPPDADFNHGDAAGYSNWGLTLVGRIVELRSGKSFDDYVEQNILRPLDMLHSTFREPVPPRFGAVPVGYASDGDALERQPPEYFHRIGPAGSLSATASDMAHFMIAMLEGGRYGEKQILSAESVRHMQSRAFSPNPYVNGSGYAFFEGYINGRRTLSHGGKTAYFQSELLLVPDQHVGIFVSSNSTGAVPEDIVRDFMDQYYPAKLPALPRPRDFSQRAARYVGWFNDMTRSYTRAEKYFQYFDPVHIEDTGHGTLEIANLNGNTHEWVEVPGHPDLFRRVDTGNTIAFTGEDGSGRATHLVGELAFDPHERIGVLEQPKTTLWLQWLFGIAFVLALVAALPSGGSGWPLARRRLAGAFGLSGLLVLIGLYVTVHSNAYMLYVRMPPAFLGALTFGLACAALAVAMAAGSLQAWRRREGTITGRVGYSLLASVGVAFAAWLHLWNLLGFHLS